MKEVWKDVKGYEGLYQISNIGRVRSLDRIDYAGRKRKGKVLKTRFNDTIGYYQVMFCKCAKKKLYKIHRLVATEFVPNKNNKPQVNHINGVKTDNRSINLEWNTAKENINHAYQTGLHKKENTLVASDIIEIRKRIKSGIRLSIIAKEFRVTTRNIEHIKNGNLWNHI